MNSRFLLLAVLAVLPLPAAQPSEALVEKLLDRIVERENVLLAAIAARTPLVETYVQETPEGSDASARPSEDHYFLGRVRWNRVVDYQPLVARTDEPPANSGSWRPFHLGIPKNRALTFLPRGFAQMAVLDLHDFNRRTYRFEYVRREFLGEVRCLVFDVEPVNRQAPGKFVGRMWVEDRDNAIVRFNGTYVQPPASRGALAERYFHFDSWRVNATESLWVPAQIYVEEQASAGRRIEGAMPHFKAQTRFWDYAATASRKVDELTSMLIESASAADDVDAPRDISPLESQRLWERQAEQNLLGRLEKGGLLAPPGPVEEVLNTVVSNLIVSSKLDIEAHCRVLLTTPFETFTIGHTIVISRGLIDVLPDEGSLALVLASELAHIALGHPTQTQFAFNNQTMLSDLELLQRFRFERPAEDMQAASEKAVTMMRASPYSNLANAGLFLKALAAHRAAMPRLLQASLGDQVADAAALARLESFAAAAPALEPEKLDQIAALPLGSRLKLDPWNNQLALAKTRPLALLSPREKMPFEVTPFVLYLTRIEAVSAEK
jgi:peptidase M48-like protein